MPFPIHRKRRLRVSESMRRLVRETHLEPSQLVLPLFACPGEGVRKEIGSMPGNFQLSIDELVKECEAAHALGIGGVILFGIPEAKDEFASDAYAENGIVQRAVRAVKRAVPELLVITDVCNCEYTSHGHCGKIVDGDVDNDATLAWLAEAAVSHARAGADIVAPSDMMDGRVAAIRHSLDAHGFQKTPILAYAAKFASVFYGPFREAAESTPQFGDRRSYQMDPANGREAMHEMELDLEEGADMLMVKPAMPYLDLIRQARDRFPVPIGAYQVSGEFSMIVAAARNGWLDLDRAMMESLTLSAAAGADIILTYFAKTRRACSLSGSQGSPVCPASRVHLAERVAWPACVMCIAMLALMFARPSFHQRIRPAARHSRSGAGARRWRAMLADVDAILGEAPSPDREAMRIKQYLDFGFIACYGCLYLVLAGCSRERIRRYAGSRVLPAAALAGVAAAAFDIIENLRDPANSRCEARGHHAIDDRRHPLCGDVQVGVRDSSRSVCSRRTFCGTAAERRRWSAPSTLPRASWD